MFDIFLGLIMPLIGTTLGASFVFFIKSNIDNKYNKILLGFAAGVMIAASIWSLIIPSIDDSSHLGGLSFIPALIGIILGVAFLLAIDKMFPSSSISEDKNSTISRKRKLMLIFSITFHNIPEGMAVGVALAGAYFGNELMTISGALALSLGIAIQNIPEGTIISAPLLSSGESKGKSFIYGVLSGVVEPISAIITFFIAKVIRSILPYVLSFAAGAMIFVVVNDLIPESQDGKYSIISTLAFVIGFLIMMCLDVALD